jgi:hypothetical protein
MRKGPNDTASYRGFRSRNAIVVRHFAFLGQSLTLPLAPANSHSGAPASN